MKAAMFYNAKDIRIEEVKEPTPMGKQVKIQVKWCGICGTDLHDYIDGPRQVQHGEPHPLTGQMLPLPMGHEFSGIVVEVGPDYDGDIKIGDKVTCDPCYYCKTCEPCRFGRYNSCEKLGFIGLASWGAFAEYMVAEDYQVYKMPDEMSFEQGAITEPACVALHAIRRAGVSLGETVAVIGLGPIGLLAVQCARAAGAAKIYGVDNQAKRLNGAIENGCTEVFNFEECDPVAEIKARTGGKGVHVAIDANGNNGSMQTAINCTRHMGTIAMPGQASSFTTDIMTQMNFPERKLVGSHVYNYEFDRCIPLIADNRIKMESIVTSKILLEDIVEKGFEELINHPADHMKILVTPDASLL